MNATQHIKLSELTKRIEDAIKQSFGSGAYWIVAEISSHKFYPSQDRHYFEFIEKADGIKDPIAKVRGVSWSNGSQYIKLFEKATGQVFTNGLQVLVKVKVEFHPTYGLSLVLIDIDESFTLGNIERHRRDTLLKLVAENPDAIQMVGEEFITTNKKLDLPIILHRIAIIGSLNSEGFTDFIHTIENNQFNYKFEIDVYYSSVQGATSENELTKSLLAIFNLNKHDCVVIIRGGGSKADFLVFDTFGLSKLVAKFPIPIITGIGHHKDVSIVDLMAHTSMKTPTKAAEFIISHNRTFEDKLNVLQKTIIIKSQQLLGASAQKTNELNLTIINKSRTSINHHKDELAKLNQTIVNQTKSIIYSRKTSLVLLLNQLVSKPQMITAHRQSDINNLKNNLQINSQKYLINKNGDLDHLDSMIKIMSPANILKKGFAIISQNGNILKDAENITVGTALKITMHDYEINTKVIDKNRTDETKQIL